MTHFEIALNRVGAGLCVLPAKLDPKMPALPTWSQFQERLPTEDELRRWFAADRPLCIVAGRVSGNLEMIDFDCAGESFPAWSQMVDAEQAGLLARLLIERSLSGGRHVVYRCHAGVANSTKLAQRAIAVSDDKPFAYCGKVHQPRRAGDHFEVIVTLLETRGEGGLFICAPTPGYELLQGDYLKLPEVTGEERELLLRAAWSLNELPPKVEPDGAPSEPCGRPGDDFNERGDVRAVLRKHGWTCVRGGDNEYWRRPGKDSGWSATLRDNVFFVFSSNAAPFDAGRAYSPFGVYTRLEHPPSDYEAGARALRAAGFGSNAVVASGVDLSALTNQLAATTSAQLIVRPLNCVQRQAVTWLWPGRIPLGKLTLLAGDPGLGKSFLTLDWAARVSRGEPWPDNSLLRQPIGKVVLFNSEDGLADTIAPRLDKLGADDCQIVAIEGVRFSGKRRHFSLETDLPLLESALATNADTRLVVIDPLAAYCGKVDSHNNSDVRGLLAPLAELAERQRVAILAVTHFSKSGGTKAVYRAMGSLAFTAAARAVWVVVKDADDPTRRLLLPAKANLAADPDGLAYRIADGRIAWNSEAVRMHADDAFAREEAAATPGNGRGQARQEAMAWLRTKLANGPLLSGDVIEEGEQLGWPGGRCAARLRSWAARRSRQASILGGYGDCLMKWTLPCPSDNWPLDRFGASWPLRSGQKWPIDTLTTSKKQHIYMQGAKRPQCVRVAMLQRRWMPAWVFPT